MYIREFAYPADHVRIKHLATSLEEAKYAT